MIGQMAVAPYSLSSQIRTFETASHVIHAAFIKDYPAFALGNGDIVFWDSDKPRTVHVHGDEMILVAQALADGVVSGGSDGRVAVTGLDGKSEILADMNGRWIDALAIGAGGALAWSASKQVCARDAKGQVQHFSAPSSVQGLAFAPKGYRVAIAHYNGVSLWFPNAQSAPEALVWKGAHLDVAFSPDGRFCLTSMQENALHGWRLSDKKDLRMTGYPAKTRSLSWSKSGDWLATSGAEGCVIWPFQSKDGPMGKAPRECGVRPAKVTRVAFHPDHLIVAIGYEDGWVLLCRLNDGREILVDAPDLHQETGAVSALCWNAKGTQLLYGCGNGRIAWLQLPKS